MTADDVRLRTPTLEVTVLNRSRHGLAIESRQALRVGAAYRFVTHSEASPTRFEGRVLWCRLERLEPAGDGEVEAVFRAGVRREDKRTP